jgi:hypothetical protein
VPAEEWLRWPGYAAAFATVLPGIFITADLIECLLFPGRNQPFASERESLPSRARTSPAPAWIALGLMLTIAPVFWPRYLFPAVWIGPIFLLEPVLERIGVRSLSLQIEAGDRQRAFSLLLAGFACGIMWEFWNFWAGSHWIYSVPYFGQWKIFQMPLLGFLGFPPFALECWILYHLFISLSQRPARGHLRIAFWICMGIFCLFVFRAIDTHTVLHFVARD